MNGRRGTALSCHLPAGRAAEAGPREVRRREERAGPGEARHYLDEAVINRGHERAAMTAPTAAL